MEDKPFLKLSSLEVQVQSKLQVTSVQGTGSLTEVTGPDFVVTSAACGCQEEVGTVEHVEPLGFELQAHALRELEGLGKGHVGLEETRSDKRVAAEIADATETRSGENGQISSRWYTTAAETAAISGI